jgi:hypothetical protein
MLFENKTNQRIKFALAGTVPDWITVRPGEKKELPEIAKGRAELHGLTLVANKKKVEAEEHSLGDKKVETKKKKEDSEES